MNLFFIFTSILFFIFVGRSIMFWTNIWQIKEYRLDRFLAHFKETSKGKEILLSKTAWAKNITLLLSLIIILFNMNVFVFYFILLISFLFFVDAFFAFKEVLTRRLKKPVLTLRALFVIVGSFVAILLLYFAQIMGDFVWLLLLSRLVFFIVTIFVFLLSLPSTLVKDYFIKKAAKKITSMKNLLVIGVSGSYGKSSTKEYISQILSTKYTVVKTHGSNNTPMGVARAILKNINDKTEIFVVEMGSYKKGEVKELCEIVNPTISITTSISDQHLSLYGSFQNIIDTEKELIDSLPKDGIALFNGNDAGALDLYNKTEKKKILYQTKSKKQGTNEIFATNILVTKEGVSFVVQSKDKKIHVKTQLLGEHTVENILPAIFIALHLKMAPVEIISAVETLKPLPKTMIKHKSSNGVIYIDDTFNASPESVEAALEYMKLYSQKKVLVLEPLIELGEHAEKDHIKLGQKIGKVCSDLFLTNTNFHSAIAKGVKESGGNCNVTVTNSQDIAEYIQETLKKEDIVVFEGREPSLVLQKIL